MVKSMIFTFLKNIFKSKQPSCNKISVAINSELLVPKSSKITNSIISIGNDSKLIIGDDVIIDNYNIKIQKGTFIIGNKTQLIGVKNTLTNSVSIENGTIEIANNCIIQSEFCVRFGGHCSIGSYTGIMYGTEIRCDEKLSIGKYNMISYDCMIFDTNTHCNYSIDLRRRLTEDNFPSIGSEIEKPETKPVSIGDDCWLGKRSVILKGVSLGDFTTVATSAVVTKSAPGNSLVYGNPAINKLKQNSMSKL